MALQRTWSEPQIPLMWIGKSWTLFSEVEWDSFFGCDQDFYFRLLDFYLGPLFKFGYWMCSWQWWQKEKRKRWQQGMVISTSGRCSFRKTWWTCDRHPSIGIASCISRNHGQFLSKENQMYLRKPFSLTDCHVLDQDVQRKWCWQYVHKEILWQHTTNTFI